jgi:hypothetical protein
MTDKEMVHQIWLLLCPDYDGLHLDDDWRLFPHYARESELVAWVCEPLTHLQDGNFVPLTVRNSIAHRAILDAAREVLDEAGIKVCKHVIRFSDKSVNEKWQFSSREHHSLRYPTRTECIYHALKWLREAKQ